MPRRSLFFKYTSVFFCAFFFGLIVLGVMLLLFQTRYFQEERFHLLERNAEFAAGITAENFAGNRYLVVDRRVLEVGYSIFARSADAEIFLTDLEGNILLGAGREKSDVYAERVVPSYAVQQMLSGNRYKSIDTFDGFFREPHYIVGVPVNIINGEMVGLMFACSSAQNLHDLMAELSKMFLLGSAVVLFVAFVFIYFITHRFIKPLKDMLCATHSFAQGDFSKRVPVEGHDEIGQLAVAFNNMASTLAVHETSRRSFVANVSHELRTPMTTISGFVDGILDGTVPEEKRDQYLGVISSEVKRLSRLVHSMLDTTRIESGEIEIHPSLFDMSEIIRKTVFHFEQSLEEKRIELRGLDAPKVMVLADIDLMHQVVYNLVENAVKFVDAEGYIEFKYRTSGGAVFTAIRNSGEGLEREEANKLFERFYKSDKSRSSGTDGVGLGLHIVKSIVNYSGGDIVVRSVEGEYTEFEFSIPIPKGGK